MSNTKELIEAALKFQTVAWSEITRDEEGKRIEMKFSVDADEFLKTCNPEVVQRKVEEMRERIRINQIVPNQRQLQVLMKYASI